MSEREAPSAKYCSQLGIAQKIIGTSSEIQYWLTSQSQNLKNFDLNALLINLESENNDHLCILY